MLPFGVTIPATVPQGSEIPEGITNNPVYCLWMIWCLFNVGTNFIFCSPCILLQILANNQLDALFMYSFISSLYIFRASQCLSSGDRIVLIHNLVWLFCVTAWYAGRESSLPTGIPSSHLRRKIIPDYVLIQFDLLMMSTVMLKKCSERK